MRSWGRPYINSTDKVTNIETVEFDEIKFVKTEDHSKWVLLKTKVYIFK